MVSYQMHVILIIGLFSTTSEQTRFVTYFSEENLSCLLEHRHLKQNETSVLEKLPLSTLTDCIVACYLRPFEDTDEEHRYLYYFIHKCAFGKKNLLNDEKIQRKSHNFDTLKSYVVLHDVSQICYLEQRSLEETKNAIAFRNITSSSLFSCIYFCQQWGSFAHCNAVSYSLKTGDCILYHDYVPGLQRSSVESSSTKFYSVFLCLDISIEVISIEIIKGTNFNFECSTEITPEQRGIVSEDFERQPFSSRGSEWMKYIASFGSRSVFLTANLYEFFEICKIKIVDPRSLKNLILHESHLRVNSLNTCLHKCRHAISEWPYRAVHYSSEKKYCHIYVKSNETSVNVTLEADEQFVELQTCFTDRRYDRANNPDALVFYIKSQREDLWQETTQIDNWLLFIQCFQLRNKMKAVIFWLIVAFNTSITECNRIIAYFPDVDMTCLLNVVPFEDEPNSVVMTELSLGKTFVIQKCENGYYYSLDTDNFVNIAAEFEIDFIRSTLWKETCIIEIKNPLDLSNVTLQYTNNLTEIRDENDDTLIFLHFCFDENFFVSSIEVAKNNLEYKRFSSSERTQSLNIPITGHKREKFYLFSPLTNKTKVEIGDLKKISEKELNASSFDQQFIYDEVKMEVNIPTFFESCEIRITSIYTPDGIFPLRTHANVRSANKCLELCRASIINWPYRAVLYSKSNKSCTVIATGLGIDEYNFNNDEIFIELGHCYLDRFEERLHNPELLKFYVKETKEICVVEFYRNNCTSDFYKIKLINNTQSIDQCISLCRIEQYSSICSAFLFTMDKECIVLGKTNLFGMNLIKPANTLLGEMLYCEEGDLTDLIQSF
ncbi:Sliding-clamp-loader large subunit [Trichinella spiralis]|uniref:Sliding-clamp-loader large subunit n=1 Tax=Trichinella spiralis TaxID=6334 RepID=A0ABR3KGU9_TRISP